ncbi:alcohol dehydrogenase catalytic domain-containing protein [Fibrella sp. HMF5335]|uniref:Alcohol dehydrogenase catalytic domain-containing protein n=1 Tax=Fibrella rubiginis TaxID=2817060 RepID=A0A939GIU8_9BACT|nr:alcohol dehydrogenase catalytic domain-containing protein [Fibrella rubiginis]MBO0938255.1 alcohol dehydrogenase catalytic domain-containing protein [Fibrella rubiginis]
MQSAYLIAPKRIAIQEAPLPEPGVGDVRVKLKLVGICGSDVHLFLGHRLLERPGIIGHEGLGYVDKLGPGVVGRAVGERVVIEPNIPCGNCRQCWTGKANTCGNKRTIGLNEPGCFADYVIVPVDFCWTIPDTISDQDAVTVEPTAVALHALLTAQAKPGDTIAVIGLGAIGLLVTHLALALGYRVLVTELNRAKVSLAEGLGALAVCPMGTPYEQSDTLAESWLRYDVRTVFECAGAALTASLATAAAPRGAEIVLVGLSAKPATFTPLKLTREGITIVPSLIYDHPDDFRRTLRLIEAGVIQPGFIVSGYAPLSDLQAALDSAAQGEASKLVIDLTLNNSHDPYPTSHGPEKPD